ncbi:helix-turn-helix domain-containing protein [Micromonospora foliorum]|uniref:helix-turn-helix domain-containing protein n=1 Tax=Micromonospora foliorum TaxID=2911210 RepID=UPI001EE78AB6|nr:AraC family transcriptional regulator [Micromonospora foliorum]MCG5440556.1 AraC family transcriptional regulator [Micromonospora foliorum]
MRQRPRGDSRGILDPGRLLREVRFRRHLPAESLRPWVEHYWLIDWALSTPFEQRVVPHPAVNVVFRRDGDRDRNRDHDHDGHGDRDGPEFGEVAGVGRDLFRITLSGTGRVSGVQFRPGGFHPFWRRPVSELTGRRVPLPTGRLFQPDGPVCGGGPSGPPTSAASDDERCRALDALLTAWQPEPDPLAEEAVRLAEAIRTDRTVLRVDDFAARHDVPVRRLQRLFLEYVGVGPKWVIRRYRLQEAVEQAAGGPLSWADLAADLGYSDQAHLVRDFTAVAGVSPAAYARSVR